MVKGYSAILGPRPADGGEEGRFAGVGQAHQAGIGQQLEAESDPEFLAISPCIGAARRPIGRRLEVHVAAPAVPAPREQGAGARLGKVGDRQLPRLGEYLRPDRHGENHIGAACAGPARALAVRAPVRLEVLAVAEIDESVQAFDGLGEDRAPVAAIAAVGSAARLIPGAPEADATAAACAALHMNLGLIEKPHDAGPWPGARLPPGARASAALRARLD